MVSLSEAQKTTSSEKEMASVAAPSDRSQRCQQRREASGTVPESKRSLLSETVPLESQLFDTTNNGPTARRHSPWHSFSDDAVFRASSLSPRESEGAARERCTCDVRRGGGCPDETSAMRGERREGWCDGRRERERELREARRVWSERQPFDSRDESSRRVASCRVATTRRSTTQEACLGAPAHTTHTHTLRLLVTTPTGSARTCIAVAIPRRRRRDRAARATPRARARSRDRRRRLLSTPRAAATLFPMEVAAAHDDEPTPRPQTNPNPR